MAEYLELTDLEFEQFKIRCQLQKLSEEAGETDNFWDGDRTHFFFRTILRRVKFMSILRGMNAIVIFISPPVKMLMKQLIRSVPNGLLNIGLAFLTC